MVVTTPGSDFEHQYLKVREQEHRIYTDEQIALLPDISPGHIHYAEWLVRKRSANRLVKYFKQKKRSLYIMEAGCGNGWLAAKLSAIAGADVTACDVNRVELQQATKVFGNIKNLHFIPGDIHSSDVKKRKYDIIIFAASIQYFPSLQNIITDSMQLLTDNGEIHLVDTQLYKEEDINAAVSRTEKYYQLVGSPAMCKYYFHHNISDLDSFKYKKLFNPAGLYNKILRKEDHFPWIVIYP
ncbi:MAG: methyltransferase domain-containing protein [Taibaiella sp.]|nr:methyltransferase domain-containing protein [Taibaiella sp.]